MKKLFFSTFEIALLINLKELGNGELLNGLGHGMFLKHYCVEGR